MGRGKLPLLIGVTLLLFAAPLAAGSRPSAVCRKVRSAIRAGQTVEQITGALRIDTAQLAQCLQQRGRRRAAKKPKAAKARSAKPHGQKSAAPAPGLGQAP